MPMQSLPMPVAVGVLQNPAWRAAKSAPERVEDVDTDEGSHGNHTGGEDESSCASTRANTPRLHHPPGLARPEVQQRRFEAAGRQLPSPAPVGLLGVRPGQQQREQQSSQQAPVRGLPSFLSGDNSRSNMYHGGFALAASAQKSELEVGRSARDMLRAKGREILNNSLRTPSASASSSSTFLTPPMPKPKQQIPRQKTNQQTVQRYPEQHDFLPRERSTLSTAAAPFVSASSSLPSAASTNATSDDNIGDPMMVPLQVPQQYLVAMKASFPDPTMPMKRQVPDFLLEDVQPVFAWGGC
eukprot:TRINITY_DN14940_c0_g1_i1.p1 TRINITY_DN14940_c0_g1~~TRINITY_DN14940_c0_g1_i1.p1  ORF type:complete len:298 (+),score=58.73 TRINITY_DN14940_c0_g1_i1:111-1004(+)